ncbi:MAG: hypothetical protein DELT_02853 [Desulfovibrio sp.]
MIRTFFCLSSLLVLSLFASGCDTGKPKLAVVDAEAVYTQSALSEKGKAYLQSLSSGFETEIEKLQKKVEAAVSDDDRKAAQEELQKSYGEIQQKFGVAQQNVAATITQSFDKALEACRAKNGYDMILLKNAVLASETRFDATQKALEEMNAMTSSVDFSVPPLVPQPALALPPGATPEAKEQPGTSPEPERQPQ